MLNRVVEDGRVSRPSDLPLWFLVDELVLVARVVPHSLSSAILLLID